MMLQSPARIFSDSPIVAIILPDGRLVYKLWKRYRMYLPFDLVWHSARSRPIAVPNSEFRSWALLRRTSGGTEDAGG